MTLQSTISSAAAIALLSIACSTFTNVARADDQPSVAGTAEAPLVTAERAVAGRPDGTSDMTGAVRDSMRSLWRASVQSPSAAAAEGSSSRLAEAVHELDQIKFAPKKEYVAAPEAGPAISAAATQPAGPYSNKPISAQALEKLKALKPGDIDDAAKLADDLFVSGQLQAAGILYDLAAQQDREKTSDKAWAIFQSANCRQGSDPAAAIALYKRVAAEFPQSQWAAPAAVRGRTLEWKQADDTQAVLRELRAGNSSTCPSDTSTAPALPAATHPAGTLVHRDGKP